MGGKLHSAEGGARDPKPRNPETVAGATHIHELRMIRNPALTKMGKKHAKAPQTVGTYSLDEGAREPCQARPPGWSMDVAFSPLKNTVERVESKR